MFPLYNTFGLLDIVIALFIFSTVLKKSDGGVSLMAMVDALLLSRLSIKNSKPSLRRFSAAFRRALPKSFSFTITILHDSWSLGSSGASAVY